MPEPLYILAAAPTNPSKLKKYFESGPNSIMDLLENPGQLRPMGWDLNTYDSPQIIRGEYLEVKEPAKLIRLYGDGTIILRALADNNFLGLEKNEEQFKKFPCLNSLALIELTYNFINFYKNLSMHFDVSPEKIKIKSELRNAFLTENAKLILTSGPVSSSPFLHHDIQIQKEAPEKDMSRDTNFKLTKIQNLPGHVVYKLIEKLYLWFGFESNDIPYTSKDEQGRKFIDIRQIEKL